jgi:hypothetical protein
MNWGRGLFRLWVVFAGLWMVGTAISFYEPIKREFKKTDLFFPAEDCRQAAKREPHNNSEGREHIGKLVGCFYPEPKFRALFPEYKDLSTPDLSDRLHIQAGLTPEPIEGPHPWNLVGFAAAIMVGVPAAVLAVCAAFYWALSGFRRTV